MSTINTGNHPVLLWPGINEIWGQVYNEHTAEYPDLYDWDSSSQAYEKDVQITGFGLAQIKPEGQSGSYDAEVQGAITNYVHIAYSLGYIVTYEELKDNLYMEVSERRAKANAFSINQTVETVAAFLYNNAFNSTYFTTADGRPLLDTAHVNPLGGTYSNELATGVDLSEQGIEDLIIQIMGAQNSRGLQINLMPESLHIPRQEWFNANRILKSVLQNDTANNAINALKATNSIPKGVRLNHFFQNASNWFIRTNCPSGMKAFWREKPNFSRDNDFGTKNALAATYMRFSVGCTDPLGLFGSEGP
jgi:hypothetical protein